MSEEQEKKMHTAVVSWSVTVEVEERDNDLACEEAADKLDNEGPDHEDVIWLDDDEVPATTLTVDPKDQERHVAKEAGGAVSEESL